MAQLPKEVANALVMLTLRAYLLSRFFQERGNVGQYYIGGPGDLSVVQSREGCKLGVWYQPSCIFGPSEEPVSLATVEETCLLYTSDAADE